MFREPRERLRQRAPLPLFAHTSPFLWRLRSLPGERPPTRLSDFRRARTRRAVSRGPLPAYNEHDEISTARSMAASAKQRTLPLAPPHCTRPTCLRGTAAYRARTLSRLWRSLTDGTWADGMVGSVLLARKAGRDNMAPGTYRTFPAPTPLNTCTLADEHAFGCALCCGPFRMATLGGHGMGRYLPGLPCRRASLSHTFLYTHHTTDAPAPLCAVQPRHTRAPAYRFRHCRTGHPATLPHASPFWRHLAVGNWDRHGFALFPSLRVWLIGCLW